MSKEYQLTVNDRQSKPRSKRLRELGGGGGTVNAYNSSTGGGGGGQGGDGHTHENKKDLDRISTDAERYVYLDGKKAKTGYADEAGHASAAANATEAQHAVNADEARHAVNADLSTTAETANGLSPEAAEKFLSAEADDTAHGKITFEQLVMIGQFIDSMVAGRGTGITNDGRIQTDRLEVRGSMSVMDLIINEIHAMAGEWNFSDCGKIEKVEVINESESTYKVWIERETEFDVTNFETDDVLLSITNNLRVGGTDYYSSWFRPVMKNVEENSLTVVLYADSQVPGGTNFPPQAGFNVTRRGNALVPPKGETNERAQSWFLSSKEGRIAFLANVFKPIVEEYNYAVSIGKLPDVKALRNIDVVGDYGVYAKTIACEHLYEIDWNGDVVPNKVDRGEWSEEVANSDKPYRFINHDKVYPDGKHHYTELEQHTVFHFGCKWGCIVDKTKDEPKWNSQGWTMLEGDPNYYLEIESTNGYAFRPANVDTHLIAHIKYGNRDITDILIGTLGSGIEWFRETKNTAEDKTWHPTIDEGDKRNKIHVRRSDMGVNWVMGYREVTFICRVTIPVGENFEKVEQRIRFK